MRFTVKRGMMGSNYLEVDTYNKTSTPFTYNYAEDYQKQIHVDEHNGYGSKITTILYRMR